MRAVRCVDRKIQVLELPSPALHPDSHRQWVRVSVRSAGICGSDLHILEAGFPVPFTLGHELAGQLSDGTPVAIEPIVGCGECEPCTRGDYNLCREGPTTVLGVGRDGGMADEISVPERCLVPLASGVPLADASLVEPLAVAVHGLRRAGLRAGERVAVVGGGTIGQCAVAAATAAGCPVRLEARHDRQREVGQRLGAALGDDGEYDLVVDAAGTSAALEQAVSLCRSGGTLLLLGTYWEGMTLPGFALCLKEIRVIPSSMYSRSGVVRDVELAASLMASRPEIGQQLITHRYPLDAAAEAFAVASDRAAGAIKVVLEA